ncbi:hypothetical protein ACFQ0Q_00660 [Streptomyces aureus]
MMGQFTPDFDRRGFLRAAAAGTVAIGAASVAGALPASAQTLAPDAAAHGASLSIPKNSIGIQLYSVRDKVSDLGFRVVFEELSRMGYKEVEFAGYTQNTSILGRQITLQEIRTLLDDNGLRAIGSHIGIGAFRSNLQQELDNAEILGMPNIGTPNAPRTPRRSPGTRRPRRSSTAGARPRRRVDSSCTSTTTGPSGPSPRTSRRCVCTTFSCTTPSPPTSTSRWTSTGPSSASSATPALTPRPMCASTPTGTRCST